MARWGKQPPARRTGDNGQGASGEGDHDERQDERLRARRRRTPLRAEQLPTPPAAEAVAEAVSEPTIWSVPPDPVLAAEVRERYRAQAARAEAQRELKRLRARHWSGERLIEEGRMPEQWWEHPDADPYAVLGLMPGAPIEEAAAARRKVAQTCHPDRLADDKHPERALRRMVAANAAYDRLRRALHPV
jgi:hypothetical protein